MKAVRSLALATLASLTFMAPAAFAQTQNVPGQTAPATREEAPPPEVAALTMPRGRFAELGYFNNLFGFFLGLDDVSRQGAAVDFTLVTALSHPIRGARFRVTRGHLDCAGTVESEIGSRLLAQDGSAIGWLPSPDAEGSSSAPPDVWHAARALLCDKATPNVSNGPAELLARTEAAVKS